MLTEMNKFCLATIFSISNKVTVRIMLKNGGEIIGDFKEEKHIILIPIK